MPSRKSLVRLCFLVFTTLLSSCCFQPLYREHPTALSVEILNDYEGSFSNYVRQSLLTHHFMDCPHAPYFLRVTLLHPEERHVGFQYDTTGAPTEAVVPNETTITERVTLSLYYQGTLLEECVYLTANTTFDHTWYATPNQVNVFSLGQLTDYGDARFFSEKNTQQELAHQIAFWLDAYIWH